MTTTLENTWSDYLDQLSSADDDEKSEGFRSVWWRRLADSGVFATLTEHGIDGGGLRIAVRRMRELGRHGSDRGLTFSAVTQLASTIYCLRAFASSDLRDRYLPAAESGVAIGGHAITEAGAGSDVMAMTATATLHGSNYILNGTKRFITNAPVASTLVVYAKTIEDGEDKGLSAFIVETAWPGVDTSEVMDTAGLGSSPIGQVVLDQVRVPISNRIGYTGGGLLILDQVMKREILLAFAANIGEMERRIARTIEHINERTQFNVTIGRNQLVANRVVDDQIAVELGSALLESIVNRLDGYDDITIPIAAAKIFISEANVESALNAIQIHGGNGYLRATGLAEELLDAVPGAIYSGSNDVLRSKVAMLLGVKS